MWSKNVCFKWISVNPSSKYERFIVVKVGKHFILWSQIFVLYVRTAPAAIVLCVAEFSRIMLNWNNWLTNSVYAYHRTGLGVGAQPAHGGGSGLRSVALGSKVVWRLFLDGLQVRVLLADAAMQKQIGIWNGKNPLHHIKITTKTIFTFQNRNCSEYHGLWGPNCQHFYQNVFKLWNETIHKNSRIVWNAVLLPYGR